MNELAITLAVTAWAINGYAIYMQRQTRRKLREAQRLFHETEESRARLSHTVGPRIGG